MASIHCILFVTLFLIWRGACFNWTGCDLTKVCMLNEECFDSKVKNLMTKRRQSAIEELGSPCNKAVVFRFRAKNLWEIDIFDTDAADNATITIRDSDGKELFTCGTSLDSTLTDSGNEITITEKVYPSDNGIHCNFMISTSEGTNLAQKLGKLRKDGDDHKMEFTDGSQNELFFENFKFKDVETKSVCVENQLLEETCNGDEENCKVPSDERTHGKFECPKKYTPLYKKSADEWKVIEYIKCDSGTFYAFQDEGDPEKVIETSRMKCVQKKCQHCHGLSFTTGAVDYHNSTKIDDDCSHAKCKTKLMLVKNANGKFSKPRPTAQLTCTNDSKWMDGTKEVKYKEIQCVDSVKCGTYQPLKSDCSEYPKIKNCSEAVNITEAPSCEFGELYYMNQSEPVRIEVECKEETGNWLFSDSNRSKVETPKNLNVLCIDLDLNTAASKEDKKEEEVAAAGFIPGLSPTLSLVLVIVVPLLLFIIVIAVVVFLCKRRKNKASDKSKAGAVGGSGDKKKKNDKTSPKDKKAKKPEETGAEPTATAGGDTTPAPPTDAAPTPATDAKSTATPAPAAGEGSTPAPAPSATPAAGTAPTPTPAPTSTPAAGAAPTPTPAPTTTPAAGTAPTPTPAPTAAPAAAPPPKSTTTPAPAAAPGKDAPPNPAPAPAK